MGRNWGAADMGRPSCTLDVSRPLQSDRVVFSDVEKEAIYRKAFEGERLAYLPWVRAGRNPYPMGIIMLMRQVKAAGLVALAAEMEVWISGTREQMLAQVEGR